ncbi:arginine--tRNA ligase [Methanobrevibacter sp. DSM 116169]|uniref:arginine--tRNA ligase n=1 Tax=Methanobrevibacter sp. DSM 116169 TaxID=3242727 RepID=UPI0038FD1D65
MYFEIEELAVASLNTAIKKMDIDDIEDEKLEFPPNPELGDLASKVSFLLAKKLKKSPHVISQDLVELIEVPEYFKKVEPVGPYVNFFIDYDKFSKDLLNNVTDDYGSLDKLDEKIILEHTSANPNGPLHIGHVRNAIIGDSLSNLLKKSGRTVETQYYVNDMGRQIAMIVFGIKELGLKIDNQDGDKIDHKIGQLYFKVNEKIKEDESLVENVNNLIKQYEKGEDDTLNKTFEEVVSFCLEGVKESLARLHIKHDKFVWEGQFVRNGDVDKVVDELTDAGFVRKNEVTYLDLIDFGIEKELVLRRSDGTSLYSTRDLAYHRWKGSIGDRIIDILGSDHKLAIDQMKHALEIMEDKIPEVIFYEFITLPEGSMSTRRGVFISVDELIDEAQKRAKDEIIKRRMDLTDDEIDKISEEIGVGAIRFYIAKLSPEKHITFKWDEALNFEKGCASIQYAHARASKLLKKSEKDINNLAIGDDWSPNENEKDLIRSIAKFTQIIEDSASKKRIHLISQYCQDLANSFNKFYKSEQVIGSPLEDTRLILVDKAKITLKNALNILGVSAPDKM